MRFSNPLALFLLLVLPGIIYLGWPVRGQGRGRDTLALGLRLLICLCLVLSLAGLETTAHSRNLSVVFLVDFSDSISAETKALEQDYLRKSLAAMGPDDQAAVVVFGAEALVERPMSPLREFDEITSIPKTGQTDIAAAIRLGLALYPPGTARRMLLISDGADTLARPGELEGAARLAADPNGSHVQLQIVDLSPYSPKGAEVLVTDLQAPLQIGQGQPFDLNLTLQATSAQTVGVRVLAGGNVVYEGSYNLKKGSQSFSLPLKAGDPGFTSYTVQVIPQSDTLYQNNTVSAYTQVNGPPKVLLVAPAPGEPLGFQGDPRPDESGDLLRALQSANLLVDLVRPSALPSDLPELAQYAAVVLVDVPARELSQRQMLAVQSYVRDLGGGLVAVGGPTSYAVGGYYHTPLEDALPVDMRIKDEKRRPSLAMVFIIDHSGSMGETSGGATKVELAKEAAIRSVGLLSPTDRVGVIAFTETASWVVPMTDLSNPNQIIAAIGTIRADGGTNILAGVQAMAKVLPSDPAQVKHVILLTDGGADETGILELVKRLNQENGITLSTVAIGSDAAPWLKDLASLGGGAYHFAADPSTIPSIFTEETTLASRAYIIEDPFHPKLASSSPILSGIDALPGLLGYVGTSAKPAAQTILTSDKDDPILASWQYGLGKAVAFTSDASGRWARDWVSWPGFAAFWSQTVRYTFSQHTQSPLNIQVEQSGQAAHVTVDASNPQANNPGNSGQAPDPYLNGLDLQANVIAPDGKSSTLVLPQTAPGRYEADYIPGTEGVYLLHISGKSANSEGLATTAGWVLSYSPEYRLLGGQPDILSKLADAGQGKMISIEQMPAAAFQHNLAAPVATHPAWPWLLIMSAVLLPFDIGVRRLVITRQDLRRAYQKLIVRLKPVSAPRPAAPVRSSPRLETLLQVKNRLEGQHPIEEPAQAARPANAATPGPAAPSPATLLPPEAPQFPSRMEENSNPESTAAALLARKRQQHNKKSP